MDRSPPRRIAERATIRHNSARRVFGYGGRFVVLPPTVPYLTPCRAPRCTVLVPIGNTHCTQHAAQLANARAGAHQSTRYGYGRAHWRTIRSVVLDAARHRCQLQLDAGCTYRATHVHLDPRLLGDHDRATPADCLACCAHCSGVVDGARSSTTWATR